MHEKIFIAQSSTYLQNGGQKKEATTTEKQNEVSYIVLGQLHTTNSSRKFFVAQGVGMATRGSTAHTWNACNCVGREWNHESVEVFVMSR